MQAQELNPGSREVRALQSKVSYELKQLKVAERESREGLMGTELNTKQLFKQEKLSYAAKLQMLRRLLPPVGSADEAKMEREKNEAIDKLASDHSDAIRKLHETNAKKLSDLLEQMETNAMNFQSELDEAIVMTRQEMEDERTAAVQEANDVAAKKVHQAEQDRESFKSL